MERRFVCQDCGVKWFIHGHCVSDPDLTECGRCGGPLAKLGGNAWEPGWTPGEGAGAEPSGLDP